MANNYWGQFASDWQALPDEYKQRVQEGQMSSEQAIAAWKSDSAPKPASPSIAQATPGPGLDEEAGSYNALDRTLSYSAAASRGAGDILDLFQADAAPVNEALGETYQQRRIREQGAGAVSGLSKLIDELLPEGGSSIAGQYTGLLKRALQSTEAAADATSARFRADRATEDARRKVLGQPSLQEETDAQAMSQARLRLDANARDAESLQSQAWRARAEEGTRLVDSDSALNTAINLVSDPLLVADTFGPDLVTMLGETYLTGFLGRLARLNKAAQVAGGVTTEIAASSAMNARGVYDEVIRKGGTREEAERARDKAMGLSVAINAVTIPLSTALDANPLTSSAAKGELIQRGTGAVSAIKTALGTGAKEALGEMPQEAGDQVASNLATGKPTWEGVPSAAVAGGVIGQGSGTIAGLASSSSAVREQLKKNKELQDEFDRRQAELRAQRESDAANLRAAEDAKAADEKARFTLTDKDRKELDSMDQPGAQMEMPIGNPLQMAGNLNKPTQYFEEDTVVETGAGPVLYRAGDVKPMTQQGRAAPLNADRGYITEDLFSGETISATKVEQRRAANQAEADKVQGGVRQADTKLTDEEMYAREVDTKAAEKQVENKKQDTFEQRKQAELDHRKALEDAKTTVSNKRNLLSTASINREAQAKLNEEIATLSARPFNQTPQGQRALPTTIANYVASRKDLVVEEVRNARIAAVNSAEDLIIAEKDRKLDAEIETKLKAEDDAKAKEKEAADKKKEEDRKAAEEAARPAGEQGELALGAPASPKGGLFEDVTQPSNPTYTGSYAGSLTDEEAQSEVEAIRAANAKSRTASGKPAQRGAPKEKTAEETALEKEFAGAAAEEDTKRAIAAKAKWDKRDKAARKAAVSEALKTLPEGTSEQRGALAAQMYTGWLRDNPEPKAPKVPEVTSETVEKQQKAIEAKEKAKATRATNKKVEKLLKEGKTKEEILAEHIASGTDEDLPPELEDTVRSVLKSQLDAPVETPTAKRKASVLKTVTDFMRGRTSKLVEVHGTLREALEAAGITEDMLVDAAMSRQSIMKNTKRPGVIGFLEQVKDLKTILTSEQITNIHNEIYQHGVSSKKLLVVHEKRRELANDLKLFIDEVLGEEGYDTGFIASQLQRKITASLTVKHVSDIIAGGRWSMEEDIDPSLAQANALEDAAKNAKEVWDLLYASFYGSELQADSAELLKQEIALQLDQTKEINAAVERARSAPLITNEHKVDEDLIEVARKILANSSPLAVVPDKLTLERYLTDVDTGERYTMDTVPDSTLLSPMGDYVYKKLKALRTKASAFREAAETISYNRDLSIKKWRGYFERTAAFTVADSPELARTLDRLADEREDAYEKARDTYYDAALQANYTYDEEVAEAAAIKNAALRAIGASNANHSDADRRSRASRRSEIYDQFDEATREPDNRRMAAIAKAAGEQSAAMRLIDKKWEEAVDAARQAHRPMEFLDNKLASARAALILSKYAATVKFGPDGLFVIDKLVELTDSNEQLPLAWDKALADRLLSHLSTGLPAKDALKLAVVEWANSGAEMFPPSQWTWFKKSGDDADAARLNTLCRGTSWCIGQDKGHALGYLSTSDFYILSDENGVGWLSLRVKDGKVVEVSGNTASQKATPEMEKAYNKYLTNPLFGDYDQKLKLINSAVTRAQAKGHRANLRWMMGGTDLRGEATEELVVALRARDAFALQQPADPDDEISPDAWELNPQAGDIPPEFGQGALEAALAGMPPINLNEGNGVENNDDLVAAIMAGLGAGNDIDGALEAAFGPMDNAGPNLAMSKQAKKVQGFTYKGKVYLVAENIPEGKERSVFLHEVGVHLAKQLGAMKGVLGSKAYDKLVGQVRAWANGTGSKENDLAKRALARAGDSDEELLAYFVEEAVASGVAPTALAEPKSAIERFLAEVYTRLKDALSRLFAGDTNFRAQDIVDITYGLAQKVYDGEVSVAEDGGVAIAEDGKVLLSAIHNEILDENLSFLENARVMRERNPAYNDWGDKRPSWTYSALMNAKSSGLRNSGDFARNFQKAALHTKLSELAKRTISAANLTIAQAHKDFLSTLPAALVKWATTPIAKTIKGTTNKLVLADGSFMPLFHATGGAFDGTFNMDYVEKGQLGIHLSPTPSVANHFLKGQYRDNNQLYVLAGKMFNPLRVKDTGSWSAASIRKDSSVPQEVRDAIKGLDNEGVRQALIELGYDGIVYKNRFEFPGVPFGDRVSDFINRGLEQARVLAAKDPAKYAALARNIAPEVGKEKAAYYIQNNTDDATFDLIFPGATESYIVLSPNQLKAIASNSGEFSDDPDSSVHTSLSAPSKEGDRVTSVYDKEKKGTILAVRDQDGDRMVRVAWDGNYRNTGHDWKAASYQPGSHADPREISWYPEEEVTGDNTDISFSINTPSSAKAKSVARGALDVIGDALTNGNYASATVTEILGRVQSLAASHIQVAIQTGKRIDESLRLRAKTTKTAYKKVQDAYDARINQIESTADPAARQGLIESFINDFQDAARGYVTNRNAIDEMTNELIRLRLMDKRPFTSREAATYTSLKNNLGDYYTRAYLLHMEGTDSKFAKLLRKQRSNADAGSTVAEDLEGRQTILDAIEFVQNSFNIIPEDSVLENKNLADLTRLAKFWAIETRTDEDDVGLRKEALIDKLSAKREKIAGTPGMSRARAVQLVDEILDNAPEGALVSYFSSATENRSILKKKEAVPLPLRKLMGEVTYNPDKALVTLTKQANLVTRTAGLFELLEYGLKSGDIISQEDYAEQGLDNKEWGQPLTGESYGPLQGYRAKTALYNRIKDITKIDVTWQDALELAENRPGTLIGKVWEEAGSKLSTAGTVYKKTMLMYNPYNMAPNLLGGPVTIVSNGGGGALHLKRAFKTAGKLVASEFTDIKDADVSEVTRAQVVDSAILGSIRAEDRHRLADMIKRFQEDKSDSDDTVKFARAWFGKRWETVKTVDKAYTEMYAMMDVVWKIANYYDIHDTLTRFNELEGTGKTAETIEREAGEQTRLSNISFSMVPKAIRALEKVPVLYIAPYYYEAIRSPIGSFILGARYMGEASRATNPEAKALMYKKGGLRMAGAATAISGIAQMAASAVLLMMAGKPEDDEEKRRARAELGASFSKFNTALYIGKDPQGRDITFDLSKFDPLGPLSQFPSMYLRGATEEEYKEAIKGLLIPNPASSGIAKAIFNMATGKESSVEGVEFRNLPLIGEELFEATMMVGPNFTKVVDVFTPTLASRNFSPTKADLSQTDQDMFTSAVTKTLQAIGAKYEVTDVPTSVSWAVRELKDTRKELSADLRTAITSRNLTENEAWEIILDAEKQERESYAKLRRIVEASATLGYKPNQVLQLMRGTPAERGLSLTDINVIASNTYATAPTAIISTDGLKGIRASILEARETPATIDLQKKNFNTLLAVLKQRNYPIRR